MSEITEVIAGLPENVKEVMDVFTEGESFDANFASDVLNAEGEISDLVAQLEAIGNIDLSEDIENLTSILGGSSFQDMSDFITDNIESVFDNASLHQTVSSIESVLGTIGGGACPGLDKAFGPFLSGRSMLDGIAELKSKIPQLPNISAELSAAQAELNAAIAGGAPSGVISELQQAVQSVQGAIADVKSEVSKLTGQVKEAMSEVNAAIAEANEFVNKATAKLSTFTDALKINNLTKDPCMQAILGSVASPRMLNLIL